jgi:2-polyprenyl-6-methoxyphenol hydroxylase-like FAD-dependent oxidoreductase
MPNKTWWAGLGPTGLSAAMKILVVGAGIGGVGLAHALSRVANVSVSLFERDAFQSARHQGLAIGLRQEAVDILLTRLQCRSIAPLFSAEGAKDLCLMNSSTPNPLLYLRGALSIRIDGSVVSSLVDRADLRNTMIEDLPRSCAISYGKSFHSYTETDSGVQVRFQDGSTAEGDVLIGADGGRSRVRAQRCPALTPAPMPIWTTAGVISADGVTAAQLEDNHLFQRSRSSLVRMAGSHGVSWLSFVHHRASRGLRLLWSISLPDAVARGFDLLPASGAPPLPPALLRERAAQLARERLCPAAAAIATLTLDCNVFPGYGFTSVAPATVRADPLAAAPASRVTLIGDAAHKTTTQAGLGATAALADAVGLADALAAAAAGGSAAAAGLRAHERSMARRAAAAVAASVSNTARIHEARPARAAAASAMLRAAGFGVRLWDWARGAPAP